MVGNFRNTAASISAASRKARMEVSISRSGPGELPLQRSSLTTPASREEALAHATRPQESGSNGDSGTTAQAVVVRRPFLAIQANAHVIEQLFSAPLSADYGFIEPIRVRELINLAVSGKDTTHCAQLMRAVAVELGLSSSATERAGHRILRTQDRIALPSESKQPPTD